MRRLLLIVLMLSASNSYAQLWSGVLDSSRAIDWSLSGVRNGIPSASWTQCGSTLDSSSTAAEIMTAIDACSNDTYVKLGPGTFNLSSGINIARSRVVLRGSGASSTNLVFTGNSNACGYFVQGAINICPGSGVHGGGGPGGQPAPNNTATWSAGYSKGTTVITISSNTNLVARSGNIPGTTIALDQENDASDGYPATGDLFVCNSGPPCSAEGATNMTGRTGKAMLEFHEVVSFTGSAPNIQVTIDPPVSNPAFRSGQNPGAWWADDANHTKLVGIEDLTVDFSATGSFSAGFLLNNVSNTWLKGVRGILNRDTTSFLLHILALGPSTRLTIRDSYFYGPTGNGTTNYAFAGYADSYTLLENNIWHWMPSPIIPADPETGLVAGYNYIHDTQGYSIGPQQHNPGDFYALYEGNNAWGFASDSNHGTHFFITYFRNHADGSAHNPSGGASVESAFSFLVKSRFFNVIGNIMGAPEWSTYEWDQVDNTGIFQVGYKGNCSLCGPLSNDARVKETLMRWGNWDNVSNATRWCGDSSNTGWTTTCSSTTEVPSSLTNYSNAVPATETIPNSFYLSGQPSWWATPYGTPPWPVIGPDVSGGSLSGAGGHANKIPARLCFENLADDPDYPSSSPRIKAFNAESCYGVSNTSSILLAQVLLLVLFSLLSIGIVPSASGETYNEHDRKSVLLSGQSHGGVIHDVLQVRNSSDSEGDAVDL